MCRLVELQPQNSTNKTGCCHNPVTFVWYEECVTDGKVLFRIGKGMLVAYLTAMCPQSDWTDRAIVEFGRSAHPGGNGSLIL